jgi:ABC-2 type transport system permease protein
VELIRFALYLQFNSTAFVIVLIALTIFLGLAILAYDPSRGIVARRVS